MITAYQVKAIPKDMEMVTLNDISAICTIT